MQLRPDLEIGNLMLIKGYLDYTFRGDLNPLKNRLQTQNNWFPIESIGININKSTKLILEKLSNFKFF